MRLILSALVLGIAVVSPQQTESPKQAAKEPTPVVELFNDDNNVNNEIHLPVFHISLFEDGRVVVSDTPNSTPRTLFTSDLFVKRIVMDAAALEFQHFPESLRLRDDLRPIFTLRIVQNGKPHTVQYSVIRGREVMEFVDKEPGERPMQMRFAHLLGERVDSVSYFAR